MAQKHQRGWLKQEKRSDGVTWMLFFRTVRESDGRRVENKIPVGLVKDFPGKGSAWAEVERQHLHINKADFRGRVTFADLAQHYSEHELGEQAESVNPKGHRTIGAYRRVLRNRLLPRWGNRVALSIEPLEIEQWLRALKHEEGLEKSDARQDAPSYGAGVRARATLRADSSKRRVKPDALCPLQNHQ